MSKRNSKRKNTKRKSKRRGNRKLYWLMLIIVLVIITCGIVYFLAQYGGVHISKDLLKSYPSKREIEVDLYFGNPSSDNLVSESRKIAEVFSQKQKITRTIKELIKGPKGKLIHTIPPTTILKNVRIDSNGVAWLDFSSHLSHDHPGGSSAEIMTIYSIVNTVLLNFREVKKVRILIEDSEIETLAGHIDCSRPLVANRDFIK